MLKSLVKKLWSRMPYSWRLRAVRSTQQKFTASVVAIVFNSEQKVLLLDHFLRPSASWALPGGFLKANEQTEEAIKRELEEETALKLENVRLIGTRNVGRHLEIVFRAEAKGEPRVNSFEINRAGWFALDEIPEGTSSVQCRLIEEALRSE